MASDVQCNRMGDKRKANTLERVHCNQCRSKTQHRRVATAKDEGSDWSEHVGDISWRTTFEMLQCCGCGEAVLRRTHEWSEDPDPDVRYFPPPVSRHAPKWSWRLPAQQKAVLAEVYRSLDADNRSLPIMGARTLVDLLMMEKVGDIGSFKHKLKELHVGGFVSTQNAEVLEAALDAGNAAAHRGHAPSAPDVNAVMDIVENLLQAVYVLPGTAQKLKKSTPPRPAHK